MDWEMLTHVATIASPIIGAIAIIVALWISHRSSRDSQKQIDAIRQSTKKQLDAMHEQMNVFMASQAPNMVESLGQYEQQLSQINNQIAKAKDEYNVVNPFFARGGARIDDIDYENKKKRQKQTIDALKKERDEIVTQIKLIKSFLNKQ